MQRGIKGALIDLQNLFGNLTDALRDAPAVHGLQSYCLEDQQVQRALHQIGWLGHCALLSTSPATHLLSMNDRTGLDYSLDSCQRIREAKTVSEFAVDGFACNRGSA